MEHQGIIVENKSLARFFLLPAAVYYYYYYYRKQGRVREQKMKDPTSKAMIDVGSALSLGNLVSQNWWLQETKPDGRIIRGGG
jgi:hypothetical protein